MCKKNSDICDSVCKLLVWDILVICFFVFSALVWGSSVKHQPQKVGKEHILNDEDVVQIVKR